MQAICTTYYGPTNTKGSRIVAKCEAGSVTHHFDHALNTTGNHAAAAEKLVRKLGWTAAEGKGYAGAWVAGAIPNLPNSLVWVLAPSSRELADCFTVEG